MASRFLQPPGERERGRLYRWSERAFAWLSGGYDRTLRAVLSHEWLMLGVVLGAVALTVFLFIRIPKGLFPQQDNGLLVGFSEAPQDVSYQTMKERQIQVNEILGAGSGHRQRRLLHRRWPRRRRREHRLGLRHPQDTPPRKLTAEQVIARLRPKLAKLVGINLYLQAGQDVQVGGRLARTQYQYTLQDPDLPSSTPGRRGSSRRSRSCPSSPTWPPTSSPPGSSCGLHRPGHRRADGRDAWRRSTARSTTPTASGRSGSPTAWPTSTAR